MAVREDPQVALVDILMPDMDGLSAVLELKRTQSTKSIPVIMITADLNYDLCQRQFSEAGTAAFLSKPFGPAQLLETIHQLLPCSLSGNERSV